MKRLAGNLVEYSSSEEDEAVPVAKKRKLPSLALSLSPSLPVDDPSNHQGRTRTAPHVEGQFAAHIYVALKMRRRSSLFLLIEEVLRESRKCVPYLHDFWSDNGSPSAKLPELHVSLSRPIYLRAHQRTDLKKAVMAVAKSHPPFTASFSTFTELVNDEKTRTFLALEIGAGHHELRKLSTAIEPSLEGIKQQAYYADPRFHASIGWALLDRPHRGVTSLTASTHDCDDHSYPTSAPSADEPNSTSSTDPSPKELSFPTIPCLPPSMITALNERHVAALTSQKVGTFTAEAITVKIGKEVSTWALSSS